MGSILHGEKVPDPVDATATDGGGLMGTRTGDDDVCPLVTADYNGDGLVDAADYVVWRTMEGSVGPGLAADGTGDERVDDEDYNLWRSQFGRSNYCSVSQLDLVGRHRQHVADSQLNLLLARGGHVPCISIVSLSGL